MMFGPKCEFCGEPLTSGRHPMSEHGTYDVRDCQLIFLLRKSTDLESKLQAAEKALAESPHHVGGLPITRGFYSSMMDAQRQAVAYRDGRIKELEAELARAQESIDKQADEISAQDGKLDSLESRLEASEKEMSGYRSKELEYPVHRHLVVICNAGPTVKVGTGICICLKEIERLYGEATNERNRADQMTQAMHDAEDRLKAKGKLYEEQFQALTSRLSSIAKLAERAEPDCGCDQCCALNAIREALVEKRAPEVPKIEPGDVLLYVGDNPPEGFKPVGG